MTLCKRCDASGVIICPTCKGIGQWFLWKNCMLWTVCLLLKRAHTAVEIAEMLDSTEPTIKYKTEALMTLTKTTTKQELVTYLDKYWDCELFQLGLIALGGS